MNLKAAGARAAANGAPWIGSTLNAALFSVGTKKIAAASAASAADEGFFGRTLRSGLVLFLRPCWQENQALPKLTSGEARYFVHWANYIGL